MFARTDTAWFQDAAARADLVCFISGRLRFYKGGRDERGGTPGSGSALIAFGTHAAGIVRRSALGAMLEPDRAHSST